MIKDNKNTQDWIFGILGLAVVLFAIAFFSGLHWLLFALTFLAILIFHEFGHFWFARRYGMKVTEFGIGFGPKLWSAKKGDLLYSFRLIPLGAFVAIPGMYKKDKLPENVSESQTYRSASFKAKLLTIAAGPSTHFISAFLIFLLLFSVFGYTGFRGDSADTYVAIEEVDANKTAGSINILEGDRIAVINGTEVASNDNVRDLLIQGGQNSITIDRDGNLINKTFFLEEDELLGVLISTNTEAEDIGTSFYLAGAELGTTSVNIVDDLVFFLPRHTVQFVKDTFSPGYNEESLNEERVAISIVGLSSIVADSFKEDLKLALIILALLNVLFGIFNLIPLLPFDGGHIAVAVYERVKARKNTLYKVDPNKFLIIGFMFVLCLLLLNVVAFINDIRNPISLF